MIAVEADKKSVLKAFQGIPGVGPSIANDLWNIGLRSVDELYGADPDDLYQRACAYEGTTIDRCLLYVFRCAVYYVSHDQH
ncbi:MAG TPA: helix-hairpin-helix domain-containing protein, partial [Aggregatilineales bacterium]|nr:helix-hairpin-helix domain-containing protein [Aggregatilineales bacterium]